MKNAVVVLSGGMDSATTLYKAIDDGYKVYAISFDYGQRHKKELDYAKKLAEKVGATHEVVDLSNITKLIDNSALTGDIDVPEGHYAEDNMKLTVVPNRNMIMYSVAIGYAVNIKAEAIYVGVHAGDHAVYPDCRPFFTKGLDLLANIATEGFSEPGFKIVAPFVHIGKHDIVAIGKTLGVPYETTHSCYKGSDKACGRCGTCTERVLAFNDNGLIDPIVYEGGWEKALEYALSL